MGKDMPLGVKIISALILIGAVIGLLAGVYLFISGSLWSGPGDKTQIGEWTFTGLSSVTITFGILLIVLGGFFIFIAINLWKGKSWARYWLNVIALLGLIGGVLQIIRNISSVIIIFIGLIQSIISGLIVWYLMRKDIKEKFN